MKCKFEKEIKEVQNPDGTWTPTGEERSGKQIEYLSSECQEIETEYRFRLLDGQYICEGDKRYEKYIREESYDGGTTWYPSYPSVYKKGDYVDTNAEWCEKKYEGHYVPTDEGDHDCPSGYIWNGFKCVYVDPIKTIKCQNTAVLSSADTKYYSNGYGLSSCEIGDCVSEIGEKAFEGRIYLSSITIPQNVKYIGSYAFTYCTSLTEIIIPKNVTQIDGGAFYGCSGLTKIVCLAKTPPSLLKTGYYFPFDETNSCPIFIPCSAIEQYKLNWPEYASRIQCLNTFIAHYSDGTEYESFDVSSDVLTTAVTRAHSTSHTAMTDCEISGFFTSIDDDAFFGCSSLTAVTMPIYLTSIGKNAFSDCVSLTSFTIPSKVTEIGSNAFKNCSNLTKVVLQSRIPPTLGSNVFDGDYPIVVPCDYVSTYKSAYPQYASRLVCNEKFYAEYYGGYSYLEECNDDNTLTREETTAFTVDYTQMTSVKIGYCAMYIEDGAFSGFTSLRAVNIPKETQTIGSNAFKGSKRLEYINVQATTPPTLSGTGQFDDTNNCKITIPCSAINDYLTQWSAYSDRIECSYKYKVTYADGSVYAAECDDSGDITTLDTDAISSRTNVTKLEFGACVTNIQRNTFSGLTNITELIIPSNVNTIGVNAFNGCSGLTSILIESEIPFPIGSGAFDNTGDCPIYVYGDVDEFKQAWPQYADRIEISYLCKLTLDTGEIVRIEGEGELTQQMVKPYSATCVSAEIGDKCTSIGSGAFSSTTLSSITIPDSVTSIGYGAFASCHLTSVTIPNSVVSIGYGAFSSTTLSSITIPDSVTSIEYFAFRSCHSLTSVTIGNGVTSIRNNAFYDCPLSEANINYATIGTEFSGNTALKTVTFGDNVTSIGDNAFSHCSGLTEATIGNSVTSIGWSTFAYCSSLTSVVIPNSVTTIGDRAFDYCYSLTSVTIGNGVTSIGEYAFDNCSGLTEVTLGNSVRSIGGYAFYGCSSLPSVTIPNSVTSIGNDAFASCSGLTEVTIPNSVVSIGTYAFQECIGLTSVTIGSGVTRIGWGVFEDCSLLSSVTIPDSVTSIGEWAFYGCTSLSSVTIPNSVTSIGDNAFQGCSNMTKITVLPETPPELGSYAFNYTNDCPIYVPVNSLDNYKSSWSSYADRINPIV